VGALVRSEAQIDRQVHIVRGAFVHTLYAEQLRSCPAGFRYDLAASTSELHGLKADLRPQSRSRLPVARWAKDVLRDVRGRCAVPNVRILRSDLPLTHSWQYPLITRNRWVVDFEDVGAFVSYQPVSNRSYASRAIKALLSSPFCRALLPWTEKARDSLVSALGPSLGLKARVVYPAVTPRDGVEEALAVSARRLLFVGSAFVSKGGVATMRAFARVRKELPHAELQMVTFLPAAYRAEAERVGGLTIHTRAPPEELDRLFREAYALVAPFSTDTLGYVVLEGFAYGVPAITSDSFALPELVGHGERGAVVPMSQSMYAADGRRLYAPVPGPHDRVDGHPLIEALAEPPAADIEALTREMMAALTDRHWRGPRARAAFESTTSGPFSHLQRRHDLAEIYEAALA
jgi:glycosyltransferase involved in cell wall biosynthesis